MGWRRAGAGRPRGRRRRSAPRSGRPGRATPMPAVRAAFLARWPGGGPLRRLGPEGAPRAHAGGPGDRPRRRRRRCRPASRAPLQPARAGGARLRPSRTTTGGTRSGSPTPPIARSAATRGGGRCRPTRPSSTWAPSPASPARPGPTTRCRHLQFSDDPEVLKREPRRFAIPVTVRSFAADSAQLQTDLALAAATLGTPGARALAVALLGDAAALPGGRRQPGPHHPGGLPVLRLGQARGAEGGRSARWAACSGPGAASSPSASTSSPTTTSSRRRSGRAGCSGAPPIRRGPRRRRRRAPRRGGPASGPSPRGTGRSRRPSTRSRLAPGRPVRAALVEALADASSREAGALYLAARAVARGRLSTAAYEFPDGGDPDADLSPDAPPGGAGQLLRAAAPRHGPGRDGGAPPRGAGRRGARLLCRAGRPGGRAGRPARGRGGGEPGLPGDPARGPGAAGGRAAGRAPGR